MILMEDDVIDWDEDYPPSVGEDNIESEQHGILDTNRTVWCIHVAAFPSSLSHPGVTNSELCRFFKYFENRDIAKEMLREKGLKKIRIGIEGQSRHNLHVY